MYEIAMPAMWSRSQPVAFAWFAWLGLRAHHGDERASFIVRY
jgi:hypothetical protein